MAEKVEPDDFSKHRSVQFPLIEFAAPLGAGLEAFEQNDRDGHREEHKPPITVKDVADADEHLGHNRQLHVESLKHGQESREHVGHEKKHDANADGANKSGVNERRAEFGLDLGETLEMVSHTAKDLDEGAAGFAGSDHVDVQVRKNARLLSHGIGEAAAFHDILFEFFTDLGRDALGFQMSHAVERDRQRHAGVQEIGQLLCESSQLLELGFALFRQGGAQREGQ